MYINICKTNYANLYKKSLMHVFIGASGFSSFLLYILFYEI